MSHTIHHSLATHHHCKTIPFVMPLSQQTQTAGLSRQIKIKWQLYQFALISLTKLLSLPSLSDERVGRYCGNNPLQMLCHNATSMYFIMFLVRAYTPLTASSTTVFELDGHTAMNQTIPQSKRKKERKKEMSGSAAIDFRSQQHSCTSLRQGACSTNICHRADGNKTQVKVKV